MSRLTGQGVWVVGAGFLGRELAALCRVAGACVVTIDATGGADVVGDAASSATLQAAYRLAVPKFVFCCMATRGGDAAAYRRCYADVVAALQGAVPAARLVFCSSVSVYGAAQAAELTEAVPAAPCGERAGILQRVEQRVVLAGGVVARLAALYGEGRCELWRRHLAGEPQLHGSPERTLNYVHVHDAAQALLLLAEKDASGVFNVCGASFTKAEAYAAMARMSGVPAVTVSAPAGKRGGVSVPVSSARLRELGWQPRPFFE